MRSFYQLLAFVIGLGILLSCFVLFHLGNGIWQFSQLVGAFVAGSLTLYLALLPIPSSQQVEPWSGKEQWSWILIGSGAVMWSIGEACWRYYILVLHQPPFPSWADVGYSSLPVLVFLGLLCLPLPHKQQSNQAFIILDSLIVAGSLLALGWFLLLGSLVSVSNENLLAQVLGLYYPTSDIALLSCIFFIMRRAHGNFYQIKARRYGLVLLGIGLAVFALSDFLFNVQQNMGTYVDGTWVDLGWPLGLLMVSIAVALRRFLPASNISPQKQPMDQALLDHPDLSGLVVYMLIGSLFCALYLNIFSIDRAQIQLRLMLLVFVLVIVVLLITRQIETIRENSRLVKRQAALLEQLAHTNYLLEMQARRVGQHNASLEQGITHLKGVLAQLANGNMQARAHISSGELLSLAGSLNLMAERISHTEMVENYLQQLTKALNDFCSALEKRRSGQSLSLPASYRKLPEMRRLVLALGIQEKSQPPSTKSKSIKAVSLLHPLSPIPQGRSTHLINTRFTPMPPDQPHSPVPDLSD